MVHVQDDLIVDGVIKADRLKAVGRLGEDFYCRTGEPLRDEKACRIKEII